MTLLSIHAILAGVTKTPLLEITEKEAAELAKGIANVQAQYPMVIDPKIQAWFGLGMVAAATYGPRIFLMRAAKAAPKPAPAQQQPRAEPRQEAKPANPASPSKGPLTPSQLYGGNYSG